MSVYNSLGLVDRVLGFLICRNSHILLDIRDASNSRPNCTSVPVEIQGKAKLTATNCGTKLNEDLVFKIFIYQSTLL